MAGHGSASTAREIALSAFERGDDAAPELLTDALEGNPHDGGLLIAHAAAQLRSGATDPFARLEALLEQAPDWIEGHKALARLKTEAGDPHPFATIEGALTKLPRHPQVWMAFLSLLAAAGRHSDAAEHTKGLRQRIGELPGLRLIEARHRGFAGECAVAGDLLKDLPDDLPELHYERARNALRLGELERAAASVERALADDSKDVGVWALAELCWRASGNERHQWLCGERELFAQIDLGLGGADLNRIADVLRSLHTARAAPLGQSVEGGTQTHGNLSARSEPEIAQLFESIRAALCGFAESLVDLPEGHPLSALKEPPQIVASWSIRLTAGGRHIPHLHDNGLVSSAAHIAVPGNLAKGEGALELGRPPEDVPLALEPLASFTPKPGHLVLFPSYLYHGTSRFSDGERLTVAFDAI